MKERKKIGFLYLMRNMRNGFVKIGYSIQPRYREATLQSEEPEIKLLAYTFATIRDEQDLQEQYAKFRLRGEWFNLTDSQVERIIHLFVLRAKQVELLARRIDAEQTRLLAKEMLA